jgi:putative RecB family exonuclease
MKVFSHSRLSCYEQCPRKYKLKYIDRVETEVEQSIEAFMGSRVHETLEKLYRDLQYEKVNSLDELLEFLRSEWKDNWDDSIVIVKEEYGPDNYLKMAERFVTDYYHTYKPFDQGRTISIEERILINLDDSGNYKLQGYIDRVMETAEGYYEVHDYKTNSRLPLPEYIENDRQLALYAIGIKERYPDVKDVKLIWHFLAFNKEIDSTRSDEELKELKRKTIELIDKIESDEKFESNTSVLCDWCEFKPVCGQWSHLYMIREKPENEYLSDPGVKLVDSYVELKQKQKQVTDEIGSEIIKIEEALISFSEKESVDVVFGSKNKIRIKESERFKFPSKNSKKREELEDILKKHGKWDEVIQLDTAALNKIILEKQWDGELLNVLKEYVELDRSKRLYVSKNNK